MEARLVLEGAEQVFSFRMQSVPGSSLREKRQFVSHATPQDLISLLNQEGNHYVKLHAGVGILVIPTGYLVMIASEGVRGIRWSLGADAADQARAAIWIPFLQESFPEYKKPTMGYNQLLEYLLSH